MHAGRKGGSQPLGLSRTRHPVRSLSLLSTTVSNAQHLPPTRRLNFMFTLSTVATNVVALPVGFALDRLGPRTVSLAGAVLFALGNFLFGLAQFDGAGVWHHESLLAK